MGQAPARELRLADSSLESVFDKIDEELSTSTRSSPVDAANYLEKYLGEVAVSLEDNPKLYWGINQALFHTQ